MNKDEQKLDFGVDFDLSKYHYDSAEKRSFSIDEILGNITDESAETDAVNPVVEVESQFQKDELFETVKHEPDPTPAENEMVKINTENKKVQFSSKKDVTPIVNTVAFDQIKAKNKKPSIVENQENAKIEKKQDVIKDSKPMHKPVESLESADETEREDTIFDLKSLLNKITAKTVVMLLLLLGSLYLTISRIENLRFLLPAQLDPSSNSSNYIITLMGLSLIAFLLNISPLFDGFKKLFTARLTFDGMALCLGTACIVYDLYCLLNTEKFLTAIITFDAVFILMLFMNLLGKRLLVKNVLANFNMFSDERSKNIVTTPNAMPIDNDVMIETGNGGDVLYASKAKKVPDLINKSFAQQDINRKTDLFYFVFFILAMLISVSLWAFGVVDLHKLTLLLTAFCALCSPALSLWIQNLLAYRLGRLLRSHSTMISGKEGALEVADCGVLVIRDTDILSNNDISLKNMNILDVYDGSPIIPVLAALFKKVGGPLEGFFEKISDDDFKGEYPDIQNICFHEQLGYTFSSDGIYFTVGTDEFMRQCRIDCPVKHLSEGINIYLAVDNKIVAGFTLVYQLPRRSARALQLLESENISIAIMTTDFCLRESMFTEVLLDSDSITILSDETARNCMPMCATKEKSPAEVVSYNAIFGIALGLVGCDMLINNLEKQSVYQITSSIFGALIIAIFGLLLPSLSFWLPFQVLLYQFVWSLPGLLMRFRLKK